MSMCEAQAGSERSHPERSVGIGIVTSYLFDACFVAISEVRNLARLGR